MATQYALFWGRSNGKIVGKPFDRTVCEGDIHKAQCWHIEGILRLIQSIPSAKAEPFKLWLARVGKERIDEIENPELGMARMQELYEKKG
jgi:hypothetical protein